ncbi:hypothetical protein N7471_013494 [Penicillium samsonianum]|uniref:uncharacterized protein n=1 Tax=Penicillium samsonianum TaxID=1882272 RepID=UPI002548593B|nr:uncharacterized protein N7471_013494 [Penicillium samsonianum]KAJ6118874.1 hypothetical protein N7471_013494 [Penicillium samsonianum]
MSPIESIPLKAGKHDAPHTVNSNSLKSFLGHISVLAASSESQLASVVLSEIAQHRNKFNTEMTS